MLLALAIAAGVGISLLLCIIVTRPDKFRIERSATMKAAPEAIYAHLEDFHRWGAWSPWEKLDASMKKTYEGPEKGAGAVYSWVGNDKVGEGRMTLLEGKSPERIAIKLEFFKPFAATNQSEFLLKPADGGVSVTWAMTGKHNFTMKAFSLFTNMDKLVGNDFEKGLADLKRIAEG
jgi:hypothetical protein